jgi:hypothetical protein
MVMMMLVDGTASSSLSLSLSLSLSHLRSLCCPCPLAQLPYMLFFTSCSPSPAAGDAVQFPFSSPCCQHNHTLLAYARSKKKKKKKKVFFKPKNVNKESRESIKGLVAFSLFVSYSSPPLLLQPHNPAHKEKENAPPCPHPSLFLTSYRFFLFPLRLTFYIPR